MMSVVGSDKSQLKFAMYYCANNIKMILLKFI